MAGKGLFGEMLEEVYPINRTAALYDLALIVIVGYIFWKALLSEPTEYFAESVGGVYMAIAFAAGIKYMIRRNIWASGGCLGMLVRLVFSPVIGFFYAPFMLWFAIRRLFFGKPAPGADS